MRHHVIKTRNGVQVYVDLIQSRAAAHISVQPHLLGLVKEVLERKTVRGPELSIEQDMGRVIGHDYVVKTTDKDTIIYAQPLRDDVFMRYVRKGKPEETQYLTVILSRDASGEYELIDTWIGHLSPPRPGDTQESGVSRAFWTEHAHIFEGQPVRPRTVTKVCPY